MRGSPGHEVEGHKPMYSFHPQPHSLQRDTHSGMKGSVKEEQKEAGVT